MLWNWATLDACFLTPSWRVSTRAGFAATCLAAVLLGMSLAALRRAARAVDAALVRAHAARVERAKAKVAAAAAEGSGAKGVAKAGAAKVAGKGWWRRLERDPRWALGPDAARFRPNVAQQVLRAVVHLMQFAVAYISMLWVLFALSNRH
jgi:copper transporter 1